MKYTYYKGLLAEAVAKVLLILKGYSLLKSRDKNHLGEIDIVARRGKTIVFVEVKFRDRKSALAESIRYRQIARIKKSALRYQPMIERENLVGRFDVIYVSWFFVRHIKNAF